MNKTMKRAVAILLAVVFGVGGALPAAAAMSPGDEVRAVYETGDYAAAAALADAYFDDHKGDTWFLYNAAQAYAAVGRMDESIHLCLRVIDMSGGIGADALAAYTQLMYVYDMLDQYDMAFHYGELYRKSAIEQGAFDDTRAAYYYYNMAIGQYNRGNFERALKLADDSVAAVNLGFNVAFQGALQAYLGNYEEALELYTLASVSPANWDVEQRMSMILVNKGDLLLKMERYDEALEAAQEAIAVFPAQLYAYVLEARVRYALGQYDLALGRLTDAQRYEFYSVDIAYLQAWIGITYRALGEEALAREHISSAMAFQPENWVDHYTKAAVCALTGDDEGAIRCLAYTFSVAPGIRHGALFDTDFSSLHDGVSLERIEQGIAQLADGMEIRVLLDGALLEFDQPPVAEGGRTLVPIRVISEAMGATVDWDQETKTATLTKDDLVVILQLDNPVMLKNGVEISLDVPPTARNNRTLVPARALSEAFGAQVDWSATEYTVYITAGV